MAYLVRIDTAADFTADNPVLLPNQIGQESDTELTKRGDGATAWNSLDYDTPTIEAFEQVLSGLTYKVPSSYAVQQAITAGATDNLSTVLSVGNSATGQNIINLQQIYSTVATKTTRLYLDSTNANLMYMSGVYGNINWLVQGTYSGTTPTISLSVYDLVSGTPYATGMAISPDSILVSGSLTGTFPGAQYGADYSANYTARSLIDKGYAAATFAPISVTNSLTATYVGFGSGGNVLTGSANLVWNGTTLSVGGYDAMTVNGVGVTSMLAIHSNTLSIYESHTHSNTAGSGASFYGARSRGTSGVPLVVQNGDALTWNAAVGYDGTDYALGGYTTFIVDDTPGNNDMPTKWILALSPNGSQTPVAAITVASTGVVTLAQMLPLSSGGTNKNMTAVNGGIVWTDANSMEVSAAGSSGQVLRSGGAAAPTWSTNTYPDTTTVSQVLYATASNVIGSSANMKFDGTSLAIGGGTISGSVEKLRIDGNANAILYSVLSNSTAGTASRATIGILTDGGLGLFLQNCSSTYTASGMLGPYLAAIHTNSGAGMNLGTISNTQLSFWTNNAKKVSIPAAGGLVVGTAALATTATDGFLYIPTCAGTPTGVPTAQTGAVAMVFDTTNNKLYIYDGGWLGGTTPGAFT